MPGYDISDYREAQFDSYAFPVTGGGPDGKQVVEGHFYTFRYDRKPTATPASDLQITRNYQSAALTVGGTVLRDVDEGGINRETTLRILTGKSEVWVWIATRAHGDMYLMTIVDKQSFQQVVSMNIGAMDAAATGQSGTGVGSSLPGSGLGSSLPGSGVGNALPGSGVGASLPGTGVGTSQPGPGQGISQPASGQTTGAPANPGSVQQAVPALHVAGTVHQQDIGDIPLADGQWAGVKEQGKRLELFTMKVVESAGVSLSYKGHLQGLGDTKWMDQGQPCGTSGQNRRVEAFALRLYGPQALNYDVFYQGHIQDLGDSPICSNGDLCGARGQGRRIESIKVWIQQRAQPRQNLPAYAFRIGSVKITNTRSPHQDTNWGVVTVSVNQITKGKTITSFGDQNNGTFQEWAIADNIQVPTNAGVRVALSIVNNGHGNAGPSSPGSNVLHFADQITLTSLKMDPIAKFSLDILGSIAGTIFANCDGVVWLDARDFSGVDLYEGTGSGAYMSYTKDFPGSNSPKGCGSNSHYNATWAVSRDQFQ